MWFSLFAIVLILAITFYQGLLGLFSAAINFFLAVLAAALAFGLYEGIYYDYLIDRQPDDGRAIVLMSIFFVSLLIMRVIVDLLIKDNMHFSLYVDRIGGGIFGFFTAMIIIGTLSVGIQMLPFPWQWLGFSRYTMYQADNGELVSLTPKDDQETEASVLAAVDLSKVNFSRNNIWLNPDGFTLALVSHLSDNALAGGNRFAVTHSNLLDDLFWNRFTQIGQKTTVARKRDAVRVETCWELPANAVYGAQRTERNTKIEFIDPAKSNQKLQSGNRYLAVRAQVGNDASDDGSTFRFNTGQVRLFTRESGGRTGSYHLVGIDEPEVAHPKDKNKDFYRRLAEGESVERKGGQFDFVFEVPKEAEPWFIEFRRNARTEITRVADKPPAARAAKTKKPAKKSGGDAAEEDSGDGGGGGGQRTSQGSTSARPRPNLNRHENTDRGAESRSGGRINRNSADLEGSFFSNELPFELTEYVNNDVEVRGDTVIGGGGRIIAKFNADDTPIQGAKTPLRKFQVPAGKHLLHLSTTRLRPGSTYGQAIDFAGQLKNVAVFDEAGKEYRAVGVWALATVGSERIFELVYFDETTRMSGAAVPRTDRIRRDNFTNNYYYYFLFEVPPRTKIVRFLAGRGNGEDLTPANLVAPD
ncbi:MAG TPA: CvpA family protein [Phycisphaerae bacterium]|nr:CvpA family protein [Phycisphaerae bacterium]HOM53204.1 CvpA family protein [Phycisphaerae bacterium]HOQ87962.1 CvpA family protein [Phycisphaerae bacterium]HPU27517.1 CvpA family protein [Phycisphaerae bacterium]HPZ96782.1 CvpA family protein [Phycisphaerae bacterium]